LHRVIDDAFREADIEISFPQSDMHLDRIGPLEVRVMGQQGTKRKETAWMGCYSGWIN
jgi:small-conductance mechanosensitive channel